jgi:protein-disulfide isomerase
MSTLKIPVGPQDHIQGDPSAPCILIEYGDYQCPHCGHAYPLVKSLQQHFGKKLAFVYRNFPLTRAPPFAQTAAEVAEFAGSKGKFWEMHDLLFENQDRLGNSLFADLAGKLGLSWKEIETAVSENTYTHRVNTEFTGGVRSGVNGTPTFFVNGQRYDGSMDAQSMVKAIETAIAAG